MGAGEREVGRADLVPDIFQHQDSKRSLKSKANILDCASGREVEIRAVSVAYRDYGAKYHPKERL